MDKPKVEVHETDLNADMVDRLEAMTQEQLNKINEVIYGLFSPMREAARCGFIEADMIGKARILLGGAGLLCCLTDQREMSAGLGAAMAILEKEPLAFLGKMELVKTPDGVKMAGSFPSPAGFAQFTNGQLTDWTPGEGGEDFPEAAALLTKAGLKLH